MNDNTHEIIKKYMLFNILLTEYIYMIPSIFTLLQSTPVVIISVLSTTS